MAFQQGLSGLNTSAKALDVIGNNIANSSTVGFKASEARFADVYAASLSGGAGVQVGIGSSLAAIAQQFTQGNISTTNNNLDLAINGSGFFRMSQNGAVSYTRNGQFHLDKSGFFTNDQGLRLTGYPATASGIINRQTPAELQLASDVLKIAPMETGTSIGGAQGVQMSVNLDSRSPVKTWVAPTATAPDPVSIDPDTYNYSTALSVFDSLGNPHTLTYYFVKTINPGEWEMYGNLDGTMSTSGDRPSLDTPMLVTFDSGGKLATVDGNPVDVSGAAPAVLMILTLPDAATTGATSPIGSTSPLAGVPLNLTGTTQYGKAHSSDRLLQDGYTAGNLAGVGVGADGTIQGRYTNGQTRNLGQLVLASFQNPHGLMNMGGNQWVETSESGQPSVDAPKSGQLGAIQSNAVEESNIDLTAELVKMITQQRNYQANAQTIKTQDQVLQTLVNLR